MKLGYFIVIALFFYISSPLHATIYKWTDDTGEAHFTDDPRKIPENYKEKAKDFDKIEQKGSVTYNPTFSAPKKESQEEEPFWKRFLREEEARAKKESPPKVTLYMTDW